MRGKFPQRPTILGFDFGGARPYYLLAVVFLAFGVWLAANARRGSFGLLLRAVRDNDDAQWVELLERVQTESVQQEPIEIFELAGIAACLRGQTELAASYFDHALELAKSMPNIMP